MNKTILVLGGDGYYGWPLAMKLAVTYPEYKIIIIDNEWRRNTIRNFGFQTLIPIARPEVRLAAFRRIHNQNNIQYIKADVNSDLIGEIIKAEMPDTIFHLAQQGSAPFSMKGPEEALLTLQNNEAGNMRLLWAVRRHVPDAHIIKLGSFGEYAKGGIDIAEGYFFPRHKGIIANRPMPYPREADDIYHVSKINDTNYVAMACRVWNMRITDVMQSTIFGFLTEEMQSCEDLYTRCDYDHIFGTVVNRFLTQAVAGYPLTVYGRGHQRTGLMALRDSVNSIISFVEDVPEAGTHRVVNHVTETNFSINELAAEVKVIAERAGYKVKIKYTHDPRQEQEPAKDQYDIETEYNGHETLHTNFEEVAGEMLGIVERFKNNITDSQFIPNVSWSTQPGEAEKETQLFKRMRVDDEMYWGKYRGHFFPSERINLNACGLGTTSAPVKEVYSKAGALDGFPLGIYEQAREDLKMVTTLCGELWPASGYKLTVTHSTSQTINLLALSMLRKWYKSGSRAYKVITTVHEHAGGIGCFDHLPEYEVHYLSDEQLADPAQLEKAVMDIQPHIAFFSQVCYDTGNLMPVEGWCDTVRKLQPECKIIIDAAQSLGLYELPFGNADVILGSTHKWLFGPHGGGLLWMKDAFHQWLEGMYWTGTGISHDAGMAQISIPGGQDFQLYPAITECLQLLKQTGLQNVQQRAVYLGKLFQKKLHNLFTEYDIAHTFLNTSDGPIVAIAFADFDPYPLYDWLNGKQIHIKCIKNHVVNMTHYHILRFGIPYYETTERLEQVIFEMSGFVGERC